MSVSSRETKLPSFSWRKSKWNNKKCLHSIIDSSVLICCQANEWMVAWYMKGCFDLAWGPYFTARSVSVLLLDDFMSHKQEGFTYSSQGFEPSMKRVLADFTRVLQSFAIRLVGFIQVEIGDNWIPWTAVGCVCHLNAESVFTPYRNSIHECVSVASERPQDIPKRHWSVYIS